jgi:hypothetical protein
VRFRAVMMAEAQELARERARALANLAAKARPARAAAFNSEELLAKNLAGAAVDALEP